MCVRIPCEHVQIHILYTVTLVNIASRRNCRLSARIMEQRWRWYLIKKQSLIIFLELLVIGSSGAQNCIGDPCMYGICLDNDNSSYSCYCIDGYTGVNCEINWDDCWSDPCLNGGTCNDAVAAYNCTCVEGFVGINCEQKYNECANHPCLNNGTCLDTDGFMCQCPEGYSGDYCEIDASVCNDTICKNSGQCLEGPGFSFLCKCTEGWTGTLCDEDVNECASSPCQNGGLCMNIPGSYTCACLFGFTGKNCDKPILPCEENLCKNGAVCLFEDEKPVCYCVPDYHGLLCELKYDDCESKFANCENGGTCIDGINSFTCTCPENYFGPTCREFVFPTSKINGTFDTTSATKETTESIFHQTSESSLTSTYLSSGIGTTFSDTTEYYTQSFPVQQEWNASTGTTLAVVNITEMMMVTAYSSTEEVDTTLEPWKTSEERSSFWTRPETSTMKFTAEGRSKTETIFDAASTGTTQNVELTTRSTTETSVKTTEASVTTETFTTETEKPTFTLTEEETGYTSTSSVTKPIVTTTLTSQVDVDRFTTEVPTIIVPSSSTQEIHVPIETTTSTVTRKEQNVTTQSEVTTTVDCIGDQCSSGSTILTETSTKQEGCGSTPTIVGSAFNGKSYARHSVLINIENGGNASLRIVLKVKTKTKNGIILHVYFDNERYALVYLELGSLKFQFSCGLQTMLLGEIDTPIDNGNEVDIDTSFQYYLQDEINKCNAKLLVNGSTAVSGEQILSSQVNVPKHASLHLGGIPVAFSHYFPHVAMGFVGCMNGLKVNEVSRHFVKDSIESFQIEKCTSFLCLSNPCRNFGACEEVNSTVHCRCVSGYTGEFCERSVCDDNPCHLGATCISSPGTGFVCVCPLESHGLLCEEDTTINRPSFSVLVPGYSSYVAYGVSNSIKDDMELRLRIIPKNLEQISLIAYLGRSGSSEDLIDYLSITYVKGYIMLTWDLGSGVRRIFTSAPLSAATTVSAATVKGYKPHTLRVGRRGRDAWLAVEGLENVTGRAAGPMTRLDVSPILYIGGHKSTNFESLPHDLPLHTGFSGCIFDIELRTGDAVFDVTSSNPATGRGVGECHRNECIRHSCKNGAVCLNHGPTYSCICTKDWTGPDCSTAMEIFPQRNSMC